MSMFEAQAREAVAAFGETALGRDPPIWLDAPWRTSLDGIFDRAWEPPEAGLGEVGVSLRVTALHVATADLAEGDEIGDGERVAVRGRSYKVVDRHDDGEGGLTLVLERADG